MSDQSSQDYLRELESLSALMDNEADDLELRRILKSCEDRPELMASWERYHLVQSVLHGAARPVSAALSERIAARIATETTPAHARPSRVSGWQQAVGKMAVAASVAVVFIFAVQTSVSPDLSPAVVQQVEQQVAQQVAQQVVQQNEAQQDQSTALDAAQSAPAMLAAETSTPIVLDPAATQYLREYLGRVAFNEEEPVITVHIQDSSLYRLVNELGAQPQ